jgi:aryl-alcohol dehydrogenase-like predicted oxidoreductase
MQLIEKTKELSTLAKELDCSLSQLSLAWCLKNPHVSSVITGATKTEQLLENLGAIEVKTKLTPDVMQKINSISRLRT